MGIGLCKERISGSLHKDYRGGQLDFTVYRVVKQQGIIFSVFQNNRVLSYSTFYFPGYCINLKYLKIGNISDTTMVIKEVILRPSTLNMQTKCTRSLYTVVLKWVSTTSIISCFILYGVHCFI